MPTNIESNACNTCAKSKRKCGRQVPCCVRCMEKGIPCVYPSSRRNMSSSRQRLLPSASEHWTPRNGGSIFSEFADNPSTSTTDLLPTDNFMWELTVPPIDFDLGSFTSLIHTNSVPTVKTEWFLAPDTWKICHDVENPADVAVIHKALMKEYVAKVQSWFERWVTTGSNPFIHPLLYNTNFPACVQIAYATLTSYIYRTPENTDAILQAVEDRSHDLVLENDKVDKKDVFAQLARLHALMVYQTIGLFDGDIRARYVAEGHIEVQSDWTNQLYQSAAQMLSSTHPTTTHIASGFPNLSYAQQQWYLWVHSECIRRTWLIARAISAIFLTLQQRTPTCPGSVMYTNRIGLWNAASATEWEKHCLNGDVAFLQRFDSVKLLTDMGPADIDEFGTAMLCMTVHRDLLEKWLDRASERHNIF